MKNPTLTDLCNATIAVHEFKQARALLPHVADFGAEFDRNEQEAIHNKNRIRRALYRQLNCA